MAVKTSNLYGKIAVTNKALRSVANFTIRESYGVANGNVSYIITDNNKVFINVRLWLKYGVTPEAVCESVRNQIRYAVENFSGMNVAVVNITVVGIK